MFHSWKLRSEKFDNNIAVPKLLYFNFFLQKEAEKKLKYKSLCIEIQRTWNLKCTIIPVTTGATGIVTRSLRKNLGAILGKHLIDSQQKTTILRMADIRRKLWGCES
jgi:hypothetical protein